MTVVGAADEGRTYVPGVGFLRRDLGRTADYYPFTHEFLGETATRIIQELPGSNRAFYDCTSKPRPGR